MLDNDFYREDQILLAAKEEEQQAQKDHERRSKGAAPDAVSSLAKFDLTLSLMEVSGPQMQSTMRILLVIESNSPRMSKECSDRSASKVVLEIVIFTWIAGLRDTDVP